MTGPSRTSGSAISAIATVASVPSESAIEAAGDGRRERNCGADLHLNCERPGVSALAADSAETTQPADTSGSATAAGTLRRGVLATVAAAARPTIAAALTAAAGSALASFSSPSSSAAVEVIGNGARIGR